MGEARKIIPKKDRPSYEPCFRLSALIRILNNDQIKLCLCVDVRNDYTSASKNVFSFGYFPGKEYQINQWWLTKTYIELLFHLSPGCPINTRISEKIEKTSLASCVHCKKKRAFLWPTPYQ